MDDQFSAILVSSHKTFTRTLEHDGDLQKVVRDKARQIYLNTPDQITFMSVTVDTSGLVYDDFDRLLFLHTHHDASALTNELPEESISFSSSYFLS